MHDHALGEETLERLVERDMTGRLHRAGEEARVEQVQDRVLDAADILIHRQPMVGDLGVGRIVFPRRGEAGEVPGRIDEGVHRVRLAPGILAAMRAGNVAPGRVTVERIARLVEGDVRRQNDRQVGLRNRHDATIITMDDRNRAAPIALTRNAPVAQAEIDLAFGARRTGQLFFLQLRSNGFERVFRRQAVEEARVDHHAVADIGLVADGEGCGIAVLRHNDRNNRQVVLAGEVEVALVTGGAAEDGARAVVHQYEICDINRQFPARIERVLGANAGIDALLFRRFQRGERGAGAAALLAEGIDFRIGRRRLPSQRMVGSDRQEGSAEERVRMGRVDGQLGRVTGGAFDQFPTQRQAFGAADPVLLHQAHLLGPLIQRVERVEQFLAEVGDAEEPLRQFALFDQRARPPAAAVDHLLIGEHGVVDRVPVDLRLLAVDEALLQEVQEQVLLALVVGGVAGREFAVPVERQAHDLELRLHRGDVLVGPACRMHAAFHGSVFGRHAEGVPAHRVQHVEAAGALVARHHVTHGVVAHVAHMDAARRIGEHLEHVVLFARIVVLGLEDLVLFPFLLPTGLGITRIVSFARHVFSMFRKFCGA
ncbi:hypothetical protein D9M72_331190 [compost metagenome]